MPTVEITAEQAAALASGRTITIAPPKPLVAVARASGHVYLIRNPFNSTYSNDKPCIRGTYSVLRHDLLKVGAEHRTGLFPNDDYTFVEVPR